MRKLFWVVVLFLFSNAVLAQEALTPVILNSGKFSRKISFKKNPNKGPSAITKELVNRRVNGKGPVNNYYPLPNKKPAPGKNPMTKAKTGKALPNSRAVQAGVKPKTLPLVRMVPTPKGLSNYVQGVKNFPGYKYSPGGASSVMGPATLNYPTLYQSK